MKKTIFNLLTVFFLLAGQVLPAQNWGGYDVNSTEVLAEAGGYQFTEGHFQKGKRFAEFLIDTRMTVAEEQAGREESIRDFQANPAWAIQQTESVDQQMQQAYQLTDPMQIALFRSAILSQLQAVFNQTNETPVMRQLIDKYTPVLAFDPYNYLAFTQKDFDGYLGLMSFYAGLTGQYFALDENTKAQYQQYFVQQFLQGTPEFRQQLCVMGVVSEYVIASYNNMPEEQKQQFLASLFAAPDYGGYQQQYGNANANDYGNYGSQEPDYTNPENMWPPGVNTKAEKQAYLSQKRAEMAAFNTGINIMNDVSLNQHATMLNIINSTGSDNYWEVKYNDW
ncbi:MAG: hypothetical protein ACE5FF_03270 [Saprospiraceae bacterium]